MLLLAVELWKIFISDWPGSELHKSMYLSKLESCQVKRLIVAYPRVQPRMLSVTTLPDFVLFF